MYVWGAVDGEVSRVSSHQSCQKQNHSSSLWLLRRTIHLWDHTGNRRFQRYMELCCIRAHQHHEGMVWGHFSSLLLLTWLYFLPPCTMSCTLVLWTLPCVTKCSSCWVFCAMHRTGFTQIWPLYVVHSTIPTNLFLHGISCNTSISHPCFLGKTAVSVRGVDWAINDLHLVTLVFDHYPNPSSPMHRSVRMWDLTVNPCHFTF